MTFGFPTNFRFGSRIGFPAGGGTPPVTPIAQVAQVSAGSTDGQNVTTGAIDTSGATLIVLGTSRFGGGGSATISDSKGNTWTALTDYNSTTPYGRIYYCENPTVGSGHTFTITGSTTSVYPSIGAMAFSSAGAYDQESGATGSAETKQPGSITPAGNDAVLVTILASQAGTNQSIDSSFVMDIEIADAGGQHLSLGMAYKVQTTASAENPTWATGLGFGQQMAVAMASFLHE